MTSSTTPKTNGYSTNHASRSLLLVEPDDRLAAVIAGHLEALGYQLAATTGDSERALEICAQGDVDLVVSGIGRCTSDGASLASVIQERLRLPVLCYVTQRDLEDERAASAGVDFGLILGEPTPERLRSAVDRVLARDRRDLEQQAMIVRLEQRLEDRKTIERAKWILVQQLRLSEPDAMRELQRKARNKQRALIDVAASVIEAAEVPSVQFGPIGRIGIA